MAYIDFRYPSFSLDQTPRLPTNFGPPNMANLFQSGISGLADPIVARLKELELQYKTGAARKDLEKELDKTGTATPAPVMPRPRDPTVAGSPAGDDTGGVQSGGVAGSANAMLDAAEGAIQSTESGGRKDPYAAVGPAVRRKDGSVDHAYGYTQVMGANVPSWTEKHYGQRLTPQEFLANPEAQRAVFRGEFGSYLDQYGNIRDAASRWFTGRPYAEARRAGASDGYNTVDQYVAKVQAALGTPAPAPAPAPQASFSPTVAPAPTPEAAATVTAPQGPQQAPAPDRAAVLANHDRAIAQALAQGDRARADQLSAMRPAIAGGGGGPQAPQSPQSGPQSPQAAGGPQGQQPDPVQAAQLKVISAADQTDQANAARLEQTRQAGRTQVASLDPSARISPTAPAPDLGIGAPRGVPTTREPPPAPDSAAISPIPITPPPMVAPRPAPSPAPAEPAAGTAVPPSAPAAVPPPTRVAEAPIPRAIAPVDPVAERVLRAQLRHARSPEEVFAIGQELLKLRQGQKPTIHTTPEGLYEYDPNTRTARALGTAGKAPPTVEVDDGRGGKRRLQYNPASNRFDIEVGGGGPAPTTPSKEVREAETKLYQDFEGNETVKKYRELEQGVQGLKAAFQSGSGTADLVAVIQLFKTIDPGSTVTGGENATFKNAAGVPETLRALFNKGVGEGGQFSPELRAEIFNTAQRLQQGRVQQPEQIAKSFRNRAKAYGLDPDRTIAFEPFKFDRAKPDDFPDNSRREGTGAVATPAVGPPAGSYGSEGNPVRIPSDLREAREVIEALPTNTYFRLPSGKVEQKR